MRVSLIVATADGRVIGRANALPWRLSADLKRFKRLTMGHHLIIGRKTWESIGRPLPGRHMIVLSRQPRDLPGEVTQAVTLAEALERARQSGDDEAFIAGGASIYAEALPLADRLYLTRIAATIPGDTYFPQVDWSGWRQVESTPHEPDDANPHPYRFEVWDRVPTDGD